MYYDTQSAPRPDNGGKTKVWKIIALVLLLLCALPVLIPVALCVAAAFWWWRCAWRERLSPLCCV